MKLYRIIHRVLFILAFIPMLLAVGPWYLTILLPLTVIVPYGINEAVLARKERLLAAGQSTSSVSAIEHAYQEPSNRR
jgi:hypothetical protein